MNIGNNLKLLRESKGLTQEEVGNAIGVTKATIARYETNEIDIKRTIAIKLASILDTTPAHIMGWNTESKIETTLFTTPKNKLYEKIDRLDKEDKIKVDSFVDGLLTHEKYSVEKSSRADYCEIAAKGGKITRGPKKRKLETTL